MITELRLRSLKCFFIELCPLYGTEFVLTAVGTGAAQIVCQYEGYARIIKDLLREEKNVAKLGELGYVKIVIKLGQREKPIAIVEVCDYLL